jgi:hypothetical protein
MTMSDSSTTPTEEQSPAPPVASDPLSILGNLLLAPADAFRSIVARPTFVLPLILSVVPAGLFTAVWSRKVDMGEMKKTQLTEMGFWDKMPPEAREQILASKPGADVWLGAMLMSPILSLVLAGFFLLVYRFFYGGDVTYRQSFAITCWTWAITGLVATPMMLLVFYLKGDWDIPPDQILQTNLSLLLEKGSVHKVLWTLAKSIDAFSVWSVFLLSTGFGIAARKPFGSAVWGVAIPWLLVIAIKMAFSAIF